jgi:2'-hydroxyisoflavone reductase
VRLLLLGGPKFLGRAVADAALAGGHELTFFNRGSTNPELYSVLYAGVEKLVGDRDGGLDALAGRRWDAVVDTSGYVPHVVRASAEALAGSGLYCFVSSISVYADFSQPIDEESELAPLGDQPVDEMAPDYSNYGALKALCEQAVRDVLGERALVVRPGLIVGPHDPTGRFTYWPHRAARGGEILAPGPPERTSQFVDVRDLGEWIVGLCERRVAGTFNATHPGVTLGELLATSVAVAGSEASVAWVTDEFLVEREVGQWMELPLWLTGPEHAYMDRADVSRALAEGLGFRPLEDTVRGTLEEASTTDASGLSAEHEAELLAAWHGRETESGSD